MQFGVYIHFPYCLSKCPYCDFASRAEAVIPQERYTGAVVRELRARAAQFPGREAVSVYFGGGTPSLWDPPQLGRVLDEVRALWRVRPEAEVTLEANPECISAAIERARARWAASFGHSRFSGNFSCRYSEMASESQTVRLPSISAGTRPLGECLRMFSAVSGMSRATTISS